MLPEREPDQGTLLVKIHLSPTHPRLHHKTPRPSPGIRASVTSSLPYCHNKSTSQLQAPCSSLPPKAALLHLLNGTVFHPFRPRQKIQLSCNLYLEDVLGLQGKTGAHSVSPDTHPARPRPLPSPAQHLTTLNWKLMVL